MEIIHLLVTIFRIFNLNFPSEIIKKDNKIIKQFERNTDIGNIKANKTNIKFI